MTNKCLDAINKSQMIGMVMIDFRKAFDFVDHTLLLKKLKYYKISEETISWFLSHLLVAGCDIGVRFFCPSVCQSVRLSTFMSTFDIYVKVSILINYKTKQPSNLA